MGKTATKLAIEGGRPVIAAKVPPLVRWDDRERKQLARMIDQPTLFYWKGPQTTLLAERFRKHCPLRFVHPCSSGTAAIHIAVAAAGIGPGDEVITSPITDMGTVIGVLYQQGVVVFADVEPHRYTLDPADVARRITPRTRAVIAVHLTGNPSRMDELKRLCDRRKLVLIEDCAQAWGATYRGKPLGTIGQIGCWSLNDFKHIGCGDGGIVACNDPTYGLVLQKFGDKAYDRIGGSRDVDVLAPNYRISEPQSAVAAVQMTRVESIARRRSALGNLLNELVADVPGVCPHEVDPKDRCSYWFYWFRIDPSRLVCDRDQFAAALAGEGVMCWGGYANKPIYRTPAFLNGNFFAGRWPVRELGLTQMDYSRVRCPVAEAIGQTAIHVTLRQNMSTGYIRGVSKAIRKVAQRYAK